MPKEAGCRLVCVLVRRRCFCLIQFSVNPEKMVQIHETNMATSDLFFLTEFKPL
jgi:hypothetical protein